MITFVGKKLLTTQNYCNIYFTHINVKQSNFVNFTKGIAQ